MLYYFETMLAAFHEWYDNWNCDIGIRIGDDQSAHNWVHYTGRLIGARAVPHRTGPVHTVGFEASRAFHAEIRKLAHRTGLSLKQSQRRINGGTQLGEHNGTHWVWLDPVYNLTNEAGVITNLDGSPSPCVHQHDRFGTVFQRTW